MEIRCTPNELKELLSNRKEEQTESREQLKRLCKEKTPVAGTTDVQIKNTVNQLLRLEDKEQLS